MTIIIHYNNIIMLMIVVMMTKDENDDDWWLLRMTEVIIKDNGSDVDRFTMSNLATNVYLYSKLCISKPFNSLTPLHKASCIFD